MKKIFVCAGMGLAKYNTKINQEAIKLGKLLADNNYVYVQGGSDKGLMGLTLREFIKYSSNVEFFIPQTYYKNDAPALIKVVGKSFKAIKTDGEAHRLYLIKSCDEIVVMPGGTGTLEELLYCNETSRSSEHNKSITIVNIGGFFDGFLQQIKTNLKEGFSKPSAIRFNIVSSVDELGLWGNTKNK